MEAILYDKTGKVKLGNLVNILDDSCYVEEERNGMFDLVFDYPNGYPLADQLIEENFVEVKPNDDQENQKFRIYNTKKFIDDTITVFARHETFDLANDHVENINLENASCEYALNTLFRNSHFSKDFRGYSDIVNAQDYKIDNVNILNAIAGKEGSIIDTYGTGAEILRDGKNIHVLNKRGHDNGVTIEYGKNLTGFELSVDLEGLETRCGGFAKYKPEGSQEEIIVKSDWIDSPFIDNFSHPYISVEGRRDYSDKFKDGVAPSKEALNRLCQDEFKINKRDIPTSNYKINFIPLSKCVGYESIEDKISLCDTVAIIDPRFNINTKAKVIKCKYDFIKERYISMELGEPRTTLGDIIGNGGKGEQGPPGPPGKDGADGNIGDFPNSLPAIPILTATVKGFASIDLSWTYEDKVYYTYEVYASKTRDFAPNTFDLIHEGQTSSFLFQAKPNETWYFRVCAKNTHGDRTDFSPQVTVTTNKADNFDEYFSTLAVGSLVTNIFSADYMEAGIIKGSWIDAKHLSVTDGNGVRTLDVDSFGKVYLQPSRFILNTSDTNVPTKDELTSATDGVKSYTDTQINIVAGKINEKVSQSVFDENNQIIQDKFAETSQTVDSISSQVQDIASDYATKSSIEQFRDRVEYKFSNTGHINEFVNGDFSKGFRNWLDVSNVDWWDSFPNISPYGVKLLDCNNGSRISRMFQRVYPIGNNAKAYTLSADFFHSGVSRTSGSPRPLCGFYVVVTYHDNTEDFFDYFVPDHTEADKWVRSSFTFYCKAKVKHIDCYLYKRNTSGEIIAGRCQFEEGDEVTPYKPGQRSLYNNIVTIDGNGVEVSHEDGSKSQFTHESVEFINADGMESLKLKNGGMLFYFQDSQERIGFIKSSFRNGDVLDNGVTLSTYADGDYIAIGHSRSGHEDIWTTEPSIMCYKDYFGGLAPGTYFFNNDVYFKSKCKVQNSVTVENSMPISFATDTSTDNKIFSSVEDKGLCFFGNDIVRLGVNEAGRNRTKLEINENDKRIHSWVDWDFHNWTVHNMRLAQTLRGQSQYLRNRTKDINDIYGSMSFTRGEIRYTCREPIKMHTDRSMIVELPQILSENMELDYHINIGKISWGDFRIKEKNNYFFEIETNVDNFEFTYEIVGKQLFDDYANVYIASKQYFEQEHSEEADSSYSFKEGSGEFF